MVHLFPLGISICKGFLQFITRFSSDVQPIVVKNFRRDKGQVSGGRGEVMK